MDRSLIKFISFNVCWSRRAKGKHEAYAIEERFDLLAEFIRSEDADVVFLQEVPICMVTQFQKLLPSHEWFFAWHNSRSGACCLATAVRRDRNVESAVQKKWPVPIPNEPDSNCLLVLEIPGREGALLVNGHLPTSEVARFAALDSIAERLTSETRPDTRVIMWGNMNTFADARGEEWIASMEERGSLEHVRVEGDSSFVPYPYDVFDAPERSIPLDNGFVRNVFVESAQLVSDGFTFEADGKEWWCSDHFATRAVLRLAPSAPAARVSAPAAVVYPQHVYVPYSQRVYAKMAAHFSS